MNEHEIERLAAACNALRPDWPAASLKTFITKNLADKPRRDVAVALAWIACETNTAKPARVLEAGPWWRAAAVEGDVTTTHTGKTVGRDVNPHKVCGICDMWRADCEKRQETSGHTFVPRSECLPPTTVEGPAFKRGTCLAGPEDAPCQLVTGHDGAHHCLPRRPAADPTPAYVEARTNTTTPPETDQPEEIA